MAAHQSDPRGKSPWLHSQNWTPPPADELRRPRQTPQNPGAGLDHPATTRPPGGHSPLNPRDGQR
jgi:hypothetical protein